MTRDDVRLLGDGWEPHIDDVGGELRYSIPVASGVVDHAFTFTLDRTLFPPLRTHPWRRLVLQHALHTLLQATTVRGGDSAMTQERFTEVARCVLTASTADVERFIDEVDRAHNIRLRGYIDRDLARLPRA